VDGLAGVGGSCDDLLAAAAAVAVTSSRREIVGECVPASSASTDESDAKVLSYQGVIY
jgi:hypothetical protein